LMVLQHVAAAQGLSPLVVSACAVVEALPCARAFPVLLDRRLVDPEQRRDGRARRAVGDALRACCAECRDLLWASGTARGLADELQSRAAAGEEHLVGALAQLLPARDVRQVAEHWARLCTEEASPDKAASRAQALLSTIINPEVCLSLWQDCASMLPYLPSDEQVAFVGRVAGFVKTTPGLLGAAVDIWSAVWGRDEGDENMLVALEQVVQASARTSAAAAPAVERLVQSFVHTHSWSPHALTLALATVEATIAPAGSPWPLTQALVPAYGFMLQHSALLATRQPVAALTMVGALASWKGDCDLGRALRGCLQSHAEAVQFIVCQGEDKRLARRIALALGLLA